jgi:putative membrane protein
VTQGDSIRLMKRPKWQTSGEEPDYRFSLANERTFLAWVRTVLAILAAAVLLHQFSPHLRPAGAVQWIAVGAALSAAALCVAAYRRWKGNEIAMRHGMPLSSGTLLACVSGALLAITLAVSILLFLS